MRVAVLIWPAARSCEISYFVTSACARTFFVGRACRVRAVKECKIEHDFLSLSLSFFFFFFFFCTGEEGKMGRENEKRDCKFLFVLFSFSNRTQEFYFFFFFLFLLVFWLSLAFRQTWS